MEIWNAFSCYILILMIVYDKLYSN